MCGQIREVNGLRHDLTLPFQTSFVPSGYLSAPSFACILTLRFLTCIKRTTCLRQRRNLHEPAGEHNRWRADSVSDTRAGHQPWLVIIMHEVAA
jgi:hypothetical protein